ncbi:MAG: carbon-nitrogen hydrolase family protein [Rhizobiales bacterium]|nr:carbon-nitrogen hydrolase family protein [Hyphomicrobiales bacterium]
MNFRAALVQMRSGRDMARNLADAAAMIREAKAGGAAYVQTPEVTNIFEPDKERLKAIAKAEADDETVRSFSELAKELGLWLHAGSFALRADATRLANRSLLFAPDGRVAARYDKIHLFDIDLPSGESHRESATYAPGAEAVSISLPIAILGLTICYDIRFPPLFNALAKAGAGVITVPSAFTVPTGEAHWHVLLRARAIETGSFVLAAAQGGVHDSGRATFGHSLAVNPWGEIIAEGLTEPQVIYADIDPAQSAQARARVPALVHVRNFDLKPASFMVS